jgi:hypothetical protein
MGNVGVDAKRGPRRVMAILLASVSLHGGMGLLILLSIKRLPDIRERPAMVVSLVDPVASGKPRANFRPQEQKRAKAAFVPTRATPVSTPTVAAAQATSAEKSPPGGGRPMRRRRAGARLWTRGEAHSRRVAGLRTRTP